MPRKSKTKQDTADLKLIIDSFTNNLESMLVFVNNVDPIAVAYDQKASKKVKKFKNDIKDIINSGGKLTVKRPNDDAPIKKLEIPKEKVDKAAEDIINVLTEYFRLPWITTAQVELLYKSSFLMLISFFDFLLYDIIHCYYKLFPEGLSDKELSINLSELKLCADRDEAIDVILDRKVDSILRESLENQMLFIKNKLKIDLKENIINWDVINEAIERRNIIAHNNSIVNRRYLRNVDLSVAPEKSKAIKDGEKLNVTAAYFKRIYSELFIAGMVITQSSWRKWMREDIEKADINLISNIFELLLREEWGLAERIGFFSKHIKVSDAASRHVLDINYCQSLKWQGKKDALNAELDKFDESNLSPRFKVALSALKGAKEDFYKNMEKAVAIGELSKEDLLNWPLFRELRQDSEYVERIEKALSQKKADESN